MDNYKDDRSILKKNIGTKFLTATIYPLSQMELVFGDIWGHGKEWEELTPDEKMYRTKWEEIRTLILDNGHKQRKHAFAEIDTYIVQKKMYEAVFTPMNRDIDGNR